MKVLKGFMILIIIIFALAPCFYISDVEFIGIDYLSKDELLREAKYNKGKFFRFDLKGELNQLIDNPYVEKINVMSKFPNRYKVTIEERVPVAYLSQDSKISLNMLDFKEDKYSGKFYYMDTNNNILSLTDKKERKLPIISGLEYKEVKIGNKIEIENDKKYQIINTLTSLVAKNIEDDIISKGLIIDVEKEHDIKIYLLDPVIEFRYGKCEKNLEKMKKIVEILKHIPSNYRGTIDIRDVNRNSSFKPIT
ncbi:MAG: FtsQ-type POTRA domain-containing protein [Clostridia bacterium]|jgi:cell division septal protein FtsQ|nr:FtsQ-type POTRA domain-containing protein [Clostridia bacterium]